MRFIFLFLPAILGTELYSQVNLQNGSATYEIPIFSFSDAKSGLGTGVSLSYSSGNGLIVSSKASNTGQNWSLIAGGAIFRKQNGEPDDQNSTPTFPIIANGNGRGFNEQIAVYDQNYQTVNVSGDPYSRDYIDNYYPNGFIYSEFPLDMVEDNYSNWPLYSLAPRELAVMARFQSGIDKKWKMSRRALADRQQDVFIFNCNGMSGEFVIGKDGNPLLINNSKIIIDKTTADLTAQNIRTRITEFTIKDANGIIYKFSAYELSEIMRFVEISNEGSSSFKKYISSGEPTGKYTIQKWLLTEIINPFTQEKILFEYDNYSLDVITEKIPSYQYTEGQSTESVQVYEQRARGQLKRLKNILLPDGHKIQFSYNESGNRVDLPGDYPLNQVKILYNNEEIDNYNLTYGYHLKKEIKNYNDYIAETDKRFARLCLSSVQRTGVNMAEPSYKFNYYTGSESSDIKDIVPPFDCMGQDHWGYYNRSSIVNNDEPNPSKEVLRDLMLNNATYRQPSPGAAKLGLLKSVETPFGGKTTIEYEQNDSKDIDNPLLTKTIGGVRVFKTTISDGINVANDIVTNYNYKLADGSTSGWGYETPTYLNRRQIKIWNASNNEGYTKDGALKYDLATTLSKIAANKIAGFAFNTAVKASFNSAKLLATVQTAAVKSINEAANVVVAYPMPEPVSLFASYVIGKMIDGLFVLFNPTDYIWSDSYSFLPFEAQNPIGINYSRVEVLNTSVPGGVGKIINEFTAPANVRTEIPTFVMPYSPKQRFASWKYGLPLKTLIYNQAGVLQKEQSNSYNIVVNQITNDNNKSCKVEVIRPESVWCWVGAQSSTIPLADFSWEYYYPITGRVELTSTMEKNYTPSGVLLQTEITKAYNGDFLDKTNTTIKSNGDLVKVKNYYTNDYNDISTAIQEMKSRNILAVLISSETWLIKPNGNEYLLDATINEFAVLTNGEIKINKIYKLETKQPLIKSLIGEQNPSVLVRNTTYFKEQLRFNYDNNGLLLETITPELRVSTKMYDHNDRIVTAEIINAAKFEVAYSSFETDQKGSWVYDLANVVTGDGVTGKKYFHFPANPVSITRSVVSAKTNRLSFWSKGNSVPIVTYGGTILSPFKTITNPVSNWTYREYMFTGSGAVSISNSSSIIDIDELRLCPGDARMATVAYDPKVGKTSECDVNNRLIYYEYDELNRLAYVRDDRKNILRKICYNYAGEPENCVNISDNTPQWRATGQTRCVPCLANSNYNSGVKEKEEKDMNPLSPTYNSLHWVTDPSGTCPTPADWVARYDLTYCEQSNGVNTGNQITPIADVNPCSSTYNQWGTPIIIPNAPACMVCNPACTEPEYKCIDGVCVLGTWSIIKVKKLGKTGPWECTYAYCFPGGLVSTYKEIITSSTACSITCY